MSLTQEKKAELISKFGVSEHLGASFTWWQGNKGVDKEGPKAGVPYDGKMTSADGTGKWLEDRTQ